jgi:hypothetical protein
MNRFLFVVVGLLCAACVVIQAQTGLSGKWQGATPSGRPIVLDVQVNKQRLTGTLTVNQQSSDISDRKVEDKTFSFVATVEGRTATFNGRLLGEEVELAPEGGPGPVTLKRVKN